MIAASILLWGVIEESQFSPREERARGEKEPCIRDLETGWLGRRTATALSACARFGS